MKNCKSVFLSPILLAVSITASADPRKDESGHGKGHKHDRREFKEEYWDGECKVKRKLEKNGEYKEERKCKAPRHVHHHAEPVYVLPPPPPVIEPGVTIHGTVRIPQ
ncbi:hypothetical protein Q8A64_03970 [Oxalobacteraceae bacterium R-40]|uniref:Uncharacterized protein n=1 Tax=Keguizhuia sedimenti TaxID=3064264 RepID=A0ABU1BKN7_9BURK|nr:hypothetical protein [Oxalobacteraceae bacterium R-40]